MHLLGLSVAAVVRREGRRLWLGGVDLVDGSPGTFPSTHSAQCGGASRQRLRGQYLLPVPMRLIRQAHYLTSQLVEYGMRAVQCALCMCCGSVMGHVLRSAGHQALPALLRRAAAGSGAAVGAPGLCCL